MFLLQVVPLIKIPLPAPQKLTYFYSQSLPQGSLVLVPLRKKNVLALVINSQSIEGKKMEIRKADYQLKPVKKIISAQPCLTPLQINLAEWISEYYWASLGIVFKTMFPFNKIK